MIVFYFNILKNAIYFCDGKTKFSAAITPLHNPAEVILICWYYNI